MADRRGPLHSELEVRRANVAENYWLIVACNRSFHSSCVQTLTNAGTGWTTDSLSSSAISRHFQHATHLVERVHTFPPTP
jgi:hypothetical protein